VNNYGANNSRNKAGLALAYVRAHMFGGCCTQWPYSKKKGYCMVYHHGERLPQAHILVCTWVNGPKPFPEAHARHLCGKGHLGCFNAACLQWGSAKDNYADAVRHGTATVGERQGASKLTDADVREIRAMRGRATQFVLADRFGVSQSLISLVQLGSSWRHVK
jgi:hypothetical protein